MRLIIFFHWNERSQCPCVQGEVIPRDKFKSEEILRPTFKRIDPPWPNCRELNLSSNYSFCSQN